MMGFLWLLESMSLFKNNYRILLVCIVITLGICAAVGCIDGTYAKKRYNNVSLTDSGLRVEEVARGPKFATGMAFLSQDDIVMIEKNTGKVIRIQNGARLDQPLLTVNVANVSERGLLGIAVSEEDSRPPYLFLYYTEADVTNRSNVLGNRLYRYDFIDNRLVNPKLLVDLPAVPGSSHNGGVLKIGPDNKSIYIVIGNVNFDEEQTYMTRTQNIKDGPVPDGRGGILRMTFDGDVVGRKGILGDEDPINKYYAYGLRNSFGIGFDPITGELWDTENGQSTNDEINLVQPGFNSGWKVIQGPSFLKKDFDKNHLEDFDGKGVYRDPEFDWFNAVAPTSVLFFNSGKLGDQYQSDLFIGSAKKGTIYHFDLNENRTHLDLDGPLSDKVANTPEELEDVIFAREIGLVTDLQVGPDGYLYVLTYSSIDRDAILFKITPK
jgi:aldose sugar dehydrogenase